MAGQTQGGGSEMGAALSMTSMRTSLSFRTSVVWFFQSLNQSTNDQTSPSPQLVLLGSPSDSDRSSPNPELWELSPLSSRQLQFRAFN